MNYNPLYGWEDGTTARIIDWVKNRGGIATACWHINIPRDFASYKLGEPVDWTTVHTNRQAALIPQTALMKQQKNMLT